MRKNCGYSERVLTSTASRQSVVSVGRATTGKVDIKVINVYQIAFPFLWSLNLSHQFESLLHHQQASLLSTSLFIISPLSSILNDNAHPSSLLATTVLISPLLALPAKSLHLNKQGPYTYIPYIQMLEAFPCFSMLLMAYWLDITTFHLILRIPIYANAVKLGGGCASI